MLVTSLLCLCTTRIPCLFYDGNLPEHNVLTPLMCLLLYRRAASGQENSWIVRSGWGARSEGVWVTDAWRRLEALAVEAEQAKQKWVVSKYVARPG